MKNNCIYKYILVAALLLAGFLTKAHCDTIPNAVYVGRWDHTSSQDHSWWPGAYFKVLFTGTTAKLQLAGVLSPDGARSFYYQIDNGPLTFYTDNSTSTTPINLTPTPLASGTHSLLVVSAEAGATQAYSELQVTGLVLDPGATTQAPAARPYLIETIGDSVSLGWENPNGVLDCYDWLVGEMDGAEHTQIAWSSIPLCDSPRYYTAMHTAYWWMQSPFYYNKSPQAWDFTRYTPAVVMVMLGHNDAYYHVKDAVFQSTYITFLSDIRATFPNAEILVMRCFNGAEATLTLNAVNARISAGDTKVHYVDTTGWLTSGDYISGPHPSPAGNLKAANLLAPIVQQYLH